MSKAMHNPFAIAAALSLGPALALGLARFAYALLLPAMREDLLLSFAAAGSLNTANAAGYLAGALCSVGWARRYGARAVLLAGCVLTLSSLVGCALTRSYAGLVVLRFVAGLSGAMVFSIGGMLVAQLASVEGRRAGLLLGLYYSGIGAGIVLAALLVPALLATGPQGWQLAWFGLAGIGLIATALIWRPSSSISVDHILSNARGQPTMWRLCLPLAASLTAYFCFGVGYIGYMTFNIALLKGQGASAAQLTLFFSLLGLAVCVSSRLWAGVLDRYCDGKAMALLNFLVGVAALLPLVSTSLVVGLLSGILFGACFMSVVASTTALVRHNLPAGQWPAGIALFTSVFALGQIIGPVLTGWLSDGAGLQKGLLFSGVIVLLGAVLALGQRALVVKSDVQHA